MPIVEKERREASALLLCIVDCEFSAREEAVPIGVLCPNIMAQHILKGTVYPLHLTVSLGLIGQGYLALDAKAAHERLPKAEVNWGPRSMIRDSGVLW